MLRYSNVVEMGYRSNMTNSLGSGIIATNPAGLYKRPSYYVMKLYADHCKAITVGVNHVPADVDIAACTSEDGNELGVFATNIKRGPVTLTLDLSGFDPACYPVSGKTVCDTLKGHHPDVMNHTAAPERVTTVGLSVSNTTITLPPLSASAIECRQQ